MQDDIIHISSKHNYLDLRLKEVWKYKDLILLFTKRSFTVSYKQTILGPLWLFINPLLTSIVYVILFGNIAKLGTDGIPMLLFYFSGNALWSFFSNTLTNNASTFLSNSGLFGKVYFPRLTVPLSNILSTFLRFLIQMIMVVVLMTYYSIKGAIQISIIRLFIIPFILIWLAILGMGLGIIISSVTTKYRDLSVLVSFGMSLWMYATPVVYPLSRVTGWIGTIISYNPVTMAMELYRYALFGTGTFSIGYIVLSVVLTIIIMFLGIIIFNKVERTFMDTV